MPMIFKSIAKGDSQPIKNTLSSFKQNLNNTKEKKEKTYKEKTRANGKIKNSIMEHQIME